MSDQPLKHSEILGQLYEAISDEQCPERENSLKTALEIINGDNANLKKFIAHIGNCPIDCLHYIHQSISDIEYDRLTSRIHEISEPVSEEDPVRDVGSEKTITKRMLAIAAAFILFGYSIYQGINIDREPTGFTVNTALKSRQTGEIQSGFSDTEIVLERPFMLKGTWSKKGLNLSWHSSPLKSSFYRVNFYIEDSLEELNFQCFKGKSPHRCESPEILIPFDSIDRIQSIDSSTLTVSLIDKEGKGFSYRFKKEEGLINRIPMRIRISNWLGLN